MGMADLYSWKFGGAASAGDLLGKPSSKAANDERPLFPYPAKGIACTVEIAVAATGLIRRDVR